MEKLSHLWTKQFKALNELGEKDRFFEIELPVYQVFLNRQLGGIAFDESKLCARLDELDDKYYNGLKKLVFDYGVKNDNLGNDVLIDYLESNKELSYLIEHIEQDNFNEYLDIAIETSDFLKIYTEVKKYRQDKNALLKFGVIGENRMFPVFDVLGTVTGRILVTDPLIQQLQKTSRDIISSEEGKCLLYPDYSQFEPGILAQLSNDAHLIELYNSQDIYNFLSLLLFGNNESRKICKKLFLAFSFGMERSSMENLIGALLKDCAGITPVGKFFDSFPHVYNWKLSIWDKLQSESRISSINGNYRYRSRLGGPLKKIEQRWAISQQVQGTASYILKKVILNLKRELPKVDILIPMHDALLLQVNESEVKEIQPKIEEIFINNYKEVCPNIMPKVVFDKFSES